MTSKFEGLFDSSVKNPSFLNRKSMTWIRSYGVGEYTSESFKNGLNKMGILHEITNPYSPESDERAEKVNRSLMGMALTMMVHYHDQCRKDL